MASEYRKNSLRRSQLSRHDLMTKTGDLVRSRFLSSLFSLLSFLFFSPLRTHVDKWKSSITSMCHIRPVARTNVLDGTRLMPSRTLIPLSSSVDHPFVLDVSWFFWLSCLISSLVFLNFSELLDFSGFSRCFWIPCFRQTCSCSWYTPQYLFNSCWIGNHIYYIKNLCTLFFKSHMINRSKNAQKSISAFLSVAFSGAAAVITELLPYLSAAKLS